MATTRSKRSAEHSGKRSAVHITVKKLIDEFIYLIDTDADYQREKVWSRKDQELLLDSIVKDVDIPKLYLARASGGNKFEYECIDGKQRLLTLSNFFRPTDDDATPLRIEIHTRPYTYKQLQQELPNIAKSMDEYLLDFVIYDDATLTDSFVREIFKRLQLGIRLNSGELLNAQLGTMREFVFKQIGKDGPFLRNTKLSDKRYSRQFTLAQICINSFSHHKDGEFVRARLVDLQDFFEDNSSISRKDQNLTRIRKVLEIMDVKFGEKAACISSRAVAVSAYLFVENLVSAKKAAQIPAFVKFYEELLQSIESDMELIGQYKKPKHAAALEQFQKHILQASVEPNAIKRRDDFLRREFGRYITKHRGQKKGS